VAGLENGKERGSSSSAYLQLLVPEPSKSEIQFPSPKSGRSSASK
jgi:hypothetical protein